MSLPPRDPFEHDGLMGVYSLLNVLQQDMKGQGLTLVHLQHSYEQLQRMIEDNQKFVEKLNSILRDGNGRQSLLTRMDMVESNLKSSTEELKEVRRILETTRNEDTRGKWSITQSVVTGLLALAAAVMTALLTQLIRGQKVP